MADHRYPVARELLGYPAGESGPVDLEAFDIGTMHDRTGPWVWSEVKGRHIWIGYLDGTDTDDDAGTVTP